MCDTGSTEDVRLLNASENNHVRCREAYKRGAGRRMARQRARAQGGVAVEVSRWQRRAGSVAQWQKARGAWQCRGVSARSLGLGNPC